MSFTDEQLVANYLEKGDEQAFEELVKRYLPLIYGFARNYTGNKENASDIAQDVFIRAWKNLSSFDRSKSFRSWLFTIAKRTSIDWLRSKKAVPLSLLPEDIDLILDDSAFEDLIAREESSKLAVAIAKLPASYNGVIRLHIDEDLNFREVATVLREPLNTVKSRYRRGISLLKKILQK